jgi:hypothetical protein
MKVELKSFTEDMLPQAGELLAQRHKRNRTKLPLLPARFEDTQVAVKAVQSLWQKKFKNGYAAFRDGRMTGYLLGDFAVQSWGRCGYVYLPGYALAEGESIQTLQDLYVLLGEDWVKKGIFSHGLYISAADADIIDALFAVGFGKERVDALLDLRSVVIPEVEEPSGVTIRLAGKGDNDHLGSLSLCSAGHLTRNRKQQLARLQIWFRVKPRVQAPDHLSMQYLLILAPSLAVSCLDGCSGRLRIE